LVSLILKERLKVYSSRYLEVNARYAVNALTSKYRSALSTSKRMQGHSSEKKSWFLTKKKETIWTKKL